MFDSTMRIMRENMAKKTKKKSGGKKKKSVMKPMPKKNVCTYC